MTLYAVRLPPDAEALEDAEVVSELVYGWDFLNQAIVLWRLVNTVHADQLESLKDRLVSSAGDGAVRIENEDLRELVRLLSGVEEAIVAAGIVDSHWRVSPERLGELVKHVPDMDLKTERSLEDKTHALGEVMINAFSIRNFFDNAVNAGCIVVRA